MLEFCKRRVKQSFMCLLVLSCIVSLMYKNEAGTATFPKEKRKSVLNAQKSLVNKNIHDILMNVTKPEDVLDRNSAWYGNLYKDTYGLPLSSFGMPSFKRKHKNWNHFVSQLQTSLQKYRLKNPSHNPNFFTRKTSIVFLHDKPSYAVGDVFVAHIQARDQLMRNKTFGGDYFRARLIRTRFEKVVDGIPCAIYDHANGMYTVKAPLLMSGDFTLEVKLLLSVEGIDRWINFTEAPTIKRAHYYALLKSNEKVTCGFHLDKFKKYKPEDLCDYSNPRNKEPWFCVKPPSGVCHPIVEHIVEKFSLDELSREITSTFGKSGAIGGSGVTITVTSADNFLFSRQYNTEHRGTTVPSGYVQNGKWESLQQTFLIKSVQSTRDCFRNKVVFFLGDSTIRQFFYVATGTFNLTRSFHASKINGQSPQIGQSKHDNITVYYKTHGMPIQLTGLSATRPYLSDTIESLTLLTAGGSNVYVIINVGVHLVHYDASYYIHRLMGIKKAILDHLKIYPETRFIFRGMNVVELTHEWALFRFEIILREIFKDLDRVVVLNVWDFTTVMPLNDYHPLGASLNEEARILFSYLCNWTL